MNDRIRKALDVLQNGVVELKSALSLAMVDHVEVQLTMTEATEKALIRAARQCVPVVLQMQAYSGRFETSSDFRKGTHTVAFHVEPRSVRVLDPFVLGAELVDRLESNVAHYPSAEGPELLREAAAFIRSLKHPVWPGKEFDS